MRTDAISRSSRATTSSIPVIGRNIEIERVIQILSRRTKNNPALIGEPGVGKTAIAEGLAQRVIKGDIPEPLRDRRVITLDLAGLVAGTKYRGEFEERMKRVMDEIRGAAGEIILFIDELHTLVGAGAAEGAIDASNIIKPALARGELQCIGATTLNEFRKHIEKDSALERRFQPVMVGEPTVEETIEILKGLRDRYEAHHKVQITDEALAARGEARRPLHHRSLPARQGRRSDRRGELARAPAGDAAAAGDSRSRRAAAQGHRRERSGRQEPRVRQGRLDTRSRGEAASREARVSSKSGKNEGAQADRILKVTARTSPRSSRRGRGFRSAGSRKPRPRSSSR